MKSRARVTLLDTVMDEFLRILFNRKTREMKTHGYGINLRILLILILRIIMTREIEVLVENNLELTESA